MIILPRLINLREKIGCNRCNVFHPRRLHLGKRPLRCENAASHRAIPPRPLQRRPTAEQRTLPMIDRLRTMNEDGSPMRIETGDGSASVATRRQLEQVPAWQSAFARQRKDRRYYEIAQHTLLPGFAYRDFV